ncbi:MAG TPA: NF038122 family metalloprotease [Blastocatellia bacterium]|nr:NF038122 family metalloprotease [Blastocatellia bacterium]
MFRTWTRRWLAIFLLCTCSISLQSFTRATTSRTPHQKDVWLAAPETDAFVNEERDGSFICRPASSDEALAMADPAREQMLHVISTGYQMQEAGGLTITLRGTAQLDGFPQARDAFLRAAENWKQRIQAPISIIIDVDFGPTRFGQPYPTGVLGSTSSQSLFNASGYPGVRAGLVSKAATAADQAIVNVLPNVEVPTDLGSTAGVGAPSALLRTLGVISATANPPAEPDFGNPPSIGFNSNFNFDFDPTDGIDSDKSDFEAVATHEIAHALGFTSRVGATELNPSTPLGLGVLDLFRFRPGVSLGTFATGQRVLSAGGTQVFFGGGSEIQLSTGRQDGSGGDGNQASHWKDLRIVTPAIGVMVPGIPRGLHLVITDNDLRVFDLMGYNPPGTGGGSNPDDGDPGGPTLKSANYDGVTLSIKGSGFAGTLQLEVNDSPAAPKKIKVKGGGNKLKISGSQTQLNIHSGENRVRVIANGLRSAVKTFTF